MKNAPLKYLASVTLGKMLQSGEATAGQEMRPYLKASNITERGLSVSRVSQMPFSLAEMFHLSILKNDVLVVEGGSIGRSVHLRHGMPGVHFQNSINRVRPHTGVDGRYIKYAIEMRLNSGYFYSITNQATIRHLTAEKLATTPIPLHSRFGMTRVADYLNHETTEIDALIADTKALIGTVDLRRRSLIDQVFLDTEWPAVALKYRGELQSGLTLGKIRDSETQSYPYLRVANVQVARVDLEDLATIDLPIAEAENYRLLKGDVLMTEGGDHDKLGRGAIWHGEIDPMLHQNHIFAFRCGTQLVPEFLTYGLEATPARVYFDQTARQSTNLASTNSTVVKNFRLPMPPVEEQRSIVASLNHELTYMADMAANAQRVADLARERRAALITAAVTGQIDVTARNKPAAEQLEDDIAQGLHREN